MNTQKSIFTRTPLSLILSIGQRQHTIFMHSHLNSFFSTAHPEPVEGRRTHRHHNHPHSHFVF